MHTNQTLHRGLLELRAENACLARITRHLRATYALGPRPTVELMLEFARRLEALAELEVLAEGYANRLTSGLLRQAGGDRFAPSPVRRVVQ